MNLYHLTSDGLAVHEASRIGLHMNTRDADHEGYLLSNGTNRGLESAITRDGDIIIYLMTNADPRVLTEDLDDMLAWFEDLGDAPNSRAERIRAGVDRLREAITKLQAIYSREAAQDCLNWYADRIEQVLEALECEQLADRG